MPICLQAKIMLVVAIHWQSVTIIKKVNLGFYKNLSNLAGVTAIHLSIGKF